MREFGRKEIHPFFGGTIRLVRGEDEKPLYTNLSTGEDVHTQMVQLEVFSQAHATILMTTRDASYLKEALEKLLTK